MLYKIQVFELHAKNSNSISILQYLCFLVIAGNCVNTGKFSLI